YLPPQRRFSIGAPNRLVPIRINEGFDGGLNQVLEYGGGGVARVERKDKGGALRGCCGGLVSRSPNVSVCDFVLGLDD
ncbi:hypothetical protein ES332_D02G187600v1, partial [Gossypium tomentosum]